MSCKHYKKALIEAAATGAALPRALRDHVAACEHCRAILTTEEALFAAVDLNLRRTASAELPDSFLPRVRSRLTEERTARRYWSPAWAAVVACAALIVGTVVVTRDWHAGAVLEVKQTSPGSGVLPNPKEETFSKDSPKVSFARIRGRRHESEVSQEAGDPRSLIPAGHQEAIDQLIDRVGSGEIRGQVLLVDGRSGQIEGLQIPGIAIASIAEISPEDTNSDSSDEPEVRAPDMSLTAAGRTK